MVKLTREFACIFKGNYYKVVITSKYKKRYIKHNYYEMKMNLTTVKYVN